MYIFTFTNLCIYKTDLAHIKNYAPTTLQASSYLFFLDFHDAFSLYSFTNYTHAIS